MRPHHLAGAVIVLLTAAALETIRIFWLDPREIAIACAHHTAPQGICAARDTIGILAHYGLIGTAALALGILALATQRFPLAVAALCCGAAGLINYNISWGMLGAALGAWTWLRAR
jgi:hypothetical protein